MNLNLNFVFSKSMNLNQIFLKSMNLNLNFKIRKKIHECNPHRRLVIVLHYGITLINVWASRKF